MTCICYLKLLFFFVCSRFIKVAFKNGLKQGEALSPLLFSLALEYAIRKVKVNKNALKLNGTHQVLVYGDCVNILGGSV